MRCKLQAVARNRRCSLAFTLVEVLVAVFIFAAVFVGFYVNLTQGFATMETTRENLRATQLLEQQMETIRLYTWTQINSNGFIPTSFTASLNPTNATATNGLVCTGTILITNSGMTESYASQLKYVTVTLNWTSAVDSVPHQRQMSTYVAEYGLHNYFY